MTPTAKRYYGGDSATSNVIRQLQCATFQEFVQRYIDSPVSLSITRAAYQGLDDDRRFAVKNKSYYCACQFIEGTEVRKDAHAESMILICLDLDPHKDDLGDETDYQTRIHDAPDAAVASLAPWNCVIHKTASSTPERPRLRVIVDAGHIPLSRHREAVLTVADRLGIPSDFKGIKESTVRSQPNFRPVLFDGEDETPVLASRTTGREMIEADIQVTTEDESRTYEWSGTDDPSAGLDQLPIQGLTVEEHVRPILDRIDPDVDRPTWIMVAAALKHQFRQPDEAEAAYHLFHEWSQKGSKYKSEKDCYIQWRSFRPDAIGKRCVTLRSVIHIAKTQFGYNPAVLSPVIQETYQQWLDRQTDHNILMTEGISRIAAMPYRSETHDSLVLSALHTRIKAVTGGDAVKRASLERDLRAHRFEEQKEHAEPPNWLRGWVFCGPENAFIRTTNMTKVCQEAFNSLHLRETGATPQDSTLPTMVAMKLHPIPVVDGMSYDPTKADEPIFQYEGKRLLNQYRTATVPEAVQSEKTAKVGALFENHIRTLVGDQGYADLIMGFIAHTVQKPGVKIRWAPIIQSAEGAGKGILEKILQGVVGKSHIHAVNPSAIEQGPWNEWAFRKVLVILNELRLSGKNRYAIANRIKDFITDDDIMKVEKYASAVSMPNTCNVMVFTNFRDCIPLEPSNRRYMVIYSPLQTKQDVLELTESGHFIKLDAIAQRRGGELRRYLLDYEIPETFPTNGPAPRTKHTQSLIEDSVNPLQLAIEDAIGTHPLIAADLIDQAALEENVRSLLRDNYPVAHYLPMLGYERGPRVNYGVRKSTVWTHRKNFDIDVDNPEEIALSRFEKMQQSI